MNRKEAESSQEELKRKLHFEFNTPDYPFLDTNNKQLIGHTSECKHCFQCGYVRALCTNSECPSKFCVWGWYTGGLVPDQLCPFIEYNPRWKSVSTNYFENRKFLVDKMVKDNEINEGKEIPPEALKLDCIGEFIFKPVNVFLLGTEGDITTEDIQNRWDWMKVGTGKPIFKIRYEKDIEKLKEDLRHQIVQVPNVGMVPNLVLKWKEDISDEYYNAVMKIIQDYESVQSVNIATRLVHSEKIQENEFLNLAYLNHSKWIYDLVDKFKGRTVLCIAGGPSLKENLKLIKENQDKFVILTVSTVAELLFKEGIVPHIIASIDMKNHNKVYLDALTEEQMKQSHFAFEIDAHHEVVDAYKGPLILTPADLKQVPGTQILKDYLPVGFEFPKSGTVSNMIYNMARMFNPKQIILAGYDLCYITDKTHIDGVRTGGNFKLVKGQGGGVYFQFNGSNNISEAIQVPIWEKDENGEHIYAWTSKAFYTYLVEIQLRIKDGGIPTYDISERATFKELAEYKPLKELLKDIPKMDINPHDVINSLDTKLLRNNVIKKILKNPINSDNKRDIRYNHVTKLVFFMKQYNSFPILKFGTVMQEFEQLVVRKTKKVLEDIVERAMDKWKKLNKLEEKNG